MLTSYYDVVVLGRRSGCLVAANLLAKQGFRVLLLGQGQPSLDFESAGKFIPRKPSRSLPAHSPAVQRALRELSLGLGEEPESADAALFQLALPNQRLDIWRDQSGQQAEFNREFPNVGRVVRELHESLDSSMSAFDSLTQRDLTWPPMTFFERRRFSRATRQFHKEAGGQAASLFSDLPPNHPFATAVRLVTQFAGEMDPREPGVLGTLRLWHQALTSSGHHNEETFARSLQKRAETQGVELRLEDSARQIDVRRGRVRGIEMSSTGEVVGAGFILSGIDIRPLVQLLPERRSFDDLFERLGEPQVRYLRYNLTLEVDATALPRGLQRHLYSVRDLAAPLHSDNALQIERRESDGTTYILSEALLPRGWVEEVDDYLPSVRGHTLDHLLSVLQLARSSIHRVDSPHDNLPPQDGEQPIDEHLREPWLRGPGQMEAIHRFPVAGPLSLCAVPCRTPVESLLLCGPQTVPGLGLEGELLAALSATQIVEHADKHKERMRRGRWTKIDL